MKPTGSRTAASAVAAVGKHDVGDAVAIYVAGVGKVH